MALLTADTYRIAAAEQLRTYANILDTPLSIIYTPEDIGKEIEKFAEYDLVLVDTAGFSHKNDGQREDMKCLLKNLPAQYERQIYLVLSATTKYKDLIEITILVFSIRMLATHYRWSLPRISEDQQTEPKK